MDIRHHSTDSLSSQAAYSDCGLYRYWLTREWSRTGGTINFVMLNPSRADQFKNDPTVERCERRARMLGFGGFCVTNIFAWRDTDPKAMRAAQAPVGPENDRVLLEIAQDARQVIAAWGTHGAHQGRGPATAALLRENGIAMHHLGLSKEGHPRHPLYVSYSISPKRWKTG
ncbi:MAG: DUF1643 domain-containing protein [Roseobacter sp.]